MGPQKNIQYRKILLLKLLQVNNEEAVVKVRKKLKFETIRIQLAEAWEIYNVAYYAAGTLKHYNNVLISGRRTLAQTIPRCIEYDKMT